jgi:hypothetical protein
MPPHCTGPQHPPLAPPFSIRTQAYHAPPMERTPHRFTSSIASLTKEMNSTSVKGMIVEYLFVGDKSVET